MTRRDLLSSSLAASTLAGLSASGDEPQDRGGGTGRDLYELKRYQLRNGPEPKLVNTYLREAAIPALNRAGIKPVGVFTGTIGPENPAIYVLIPYPSPAAMANIRMTLAQDEEYRRQAAEYFNVSASQPAYLRFQIWLLEAFETVPRIEVPPATSENRPRIFELRTYENPSEKANFTKLRMFNTAEISIFRRTGLRPVFFGNTLIGDRMPCLTYMLTFKDLAEREKNWGIFGSDPEWKKLSTTPGYTDPEIITNISNIILSPAAYSQI
jgi:NIPSNAP